MFTLSTILRGAAKCLDMPNPKPPKCSLQVVRRSLKILKTINITWHELPTRLIADALRPMINKFLKLSTLLSHNLIWQKVLHLLSAHLKVAYKPALKELRRSSFSYQVSIIWIHLTYFETPPMELNKLLTTEAYDSCWICRRKHFPLDCSSQRVQSVWNNLLAGTYFIFRKIVNARARRYHRQWIPHGNFL